MDSSFSASSRRSYDIPKPETGLAEWTSKIKALQREVDADEEVEQKRLEEEISAARQARLRRSRGAGAGGRLDSVDMSSNKEELQKLGSFSDTTSNDTPKSVAERAMDQDTALRRLMGRNDVYNPDKISGSTPSRSNTEPANSISLASFIGGRASGPRLNRHAPQQDAHDPTQFVQPDVSAPHPVFGKGGIAMPGMAAKRDSKATNSIAGTEISERYQPSSAKSTPFKLSPSGSSTPSPYSTPAPELNKHDNVDLHRRSFTSKTSNSSAFPSSSDPSRVDSSNDSSAQLRSELSQPTPTSYTPAYKINALNAQVKKEETNFRDSPPSFSTSAETFPSTVPPATAKPMPSYLGTTSYTSKPSSISNTPRNVETSVNTTQTPLRRLMETNNVYNPDKLDAPRKTIAERAQSVSLAGFMGGNASGIRLNKHATQPDAHDPTQFIQPDTSAPHPIFGRGGIAMPGLATRKMEPTPNPSNDSPERYRPSGTKAIWPPVQTTYIEKTQEARSISPQKTGNRERTLSTPGSRPNPVSSSSQSSDTWSVSTNNIGRRSPVKDTWTRDRTISTPSNHNPVASSINTPSLARPIQPIPKSASISPLLSTAIPSPAFQKPAPSKDLTPSISRLQGRGFVQSMVKVSSQLDVPASPTPSSMDKSRPTSASGRKSSVLDRWQPHMRSPSPTKSSSPSFSTPIRRSATQEPTSYVNSARTPASATDQSSHALKSMASLPSLAKVSSTPPVQASTDESSNSVAEPYQRSRTPGLGSATTMVLIKSSKSVTDLKQLAHVDELGVKHDAVAATSSKKPLIHPTKERARKPKKVADTHGIADSNLTQGDSGSGNGINPLSERREVLQSIPLSKLMISHSENFMQTTEQVLSPVDILRPTKAITSLDAESVVENFNTKETALRDSILDLKGGALDSFIPPVRKSTSAPSIPVTLSFGKLSRVPSTGSRPTVMEVAKVLREQTDNKPPSPVKNSSLPTAEESEPAPKPRAMQTPPEKRKSSYDKYSSFMLPPLKEEVTPTPTPVGTLNLKNTVLPESRTSAVVEEAVIVVNAPATEVRPDTNATKPNIIQIKEEDQPLPDIEVATFLKSHYFRPAEQNADVQTISAEVLLLTGTTARPITGPLNIFYESEMLVVVHRVKLKSSGLASTSVWCWLGRKSILGDREERKLHEIANRYGTMAKIIHQLAEQPELIQVLGGTLIIRQGTRTHWSSDNVTMHLLRSLNGVIIIDEIDLNVKNLCSAFSYCLSILGSIYVWYGCGSTDEERTAAMKYAKSLSGDQITPIELLEGESDDDEMFWMMLGNDDFAQADYWKWRKTFPSADPIIWRIEPDNARQMVTAIQFISLEKSIQTSVYVIDCIWELFVLVGKEARCNKRAIRFALNVAKQVSHEVASLRPFSPTLHALVLPSRIPLDLQLGVRDFDEAWLNNGEIPDHMNLLSYSEASTHLSASAWDRAALKDCDMLPLGVGLTDII